MAKIFNLSNHPNTNVNEACEQQSPIVSDELKKDYNFCGDNSNLFPDCDKKLGFAPQGDPMTRGKITNDMEDGPNRDVIYRHARSIDGCHQAVQDLFNDIVILDDDGTKYPVPIMYGSQERAVLHIVQNSIRKDNTLVIDRPVLPLMAIHHSGGVTFRKEHYVYHKAMRYQKVAVQPGLMQEIRERDTVFGFSMGIPVNLDYKLIVWTKSTVDLYTIVEQIYPRITPGGTVKVKGVPWEVLVKLDSDGNNINYEPGDKEIGVRKWEFNFHAETWLVQPIARKRSVLEMNVNVVNKNNADDTFFSVEITE